MLAGLAASNIAWPHEDFERAIHVVQELGLQGIEIAPFNVFGRWDVSDGEVGHLRARLNNAGLVCPALQGILFNAPGAALFESDRSRDLLAKHLEKVAHLAGLLGASACVFGAPRQRDPGSLPPDEAWDTAVAFLRRVGPCFADKGTSLAFEANAQLYACRFITTTAEAVELVRAANTPGISLQIDMGTIFLEEEDPEILLPAAALATHAHASEPNLQPLGSGALDHQPLARALRASGYSRFLSIEMRAVPDWENALRDAAALLKRDYL